MGNVFKFHAAYVFVKRDLEYAGLWVVLVARYKGVSFFVVERVFFDYWVVIQVIDLDHVVPLRSL